MSGPLFTFVTSYCRYCVVPLQHLLDSLPLGLMDGPNAQVELVLTGNEPRSGDVKASGTRGIAAFSCLCWLGVMPEKAMTSCLGSSASEAPSNRGRAGFANSLMYEMASSSSRDCGSWPRAEGLSDELRRWRRMASAREFGIDGGLDVVVCLVCLSMYASACCGVDDSSSAAAAATPANTGSRKLFSFILGGLFGTSI